MVGTFIAELKRRNVLRAMVLYIGAVWALAQGIAQIGPEVGAPEATTRWFLIASAIGFPLWVAFSWFFELTSEGIKRESEIAPEARANQSHRKTDLIIIGVLAIAVVLLLTDRLIEHKPEARTPIAASASDNSIAVLPFDNESGDKEQQYFSDGLSEGFIIALSRLQGMRVIGRNSSFQFRDSKDDSQAIASKLGVAHLLEGSVRRAGNTVRISASLIKAADGSTLWAESYDRPYTDLFKLQDQIVGQVAQALQAKLQPAPVQAQQGDRPPSGNLEAYNLYLKAHSSGDTEAAVRLYDAALRLDPNYGLAYAMKARTLIDAVSGGLTGKQADDFFAEADAAVSKAMQLAPALAAPHVARGWLLMLRDFNWKDGEAELRKAVALAPEDGDALYQLGVARASQGDLTQAVELTRRAIKLDPMNANWYRWLVAYLMPLGRLDEAHHAITKAIELEPSAIYNHHLLAMIEVLRKDPQAAQAAAKAEPAGPWQDFALALAAQIGTDRAEADARLQAGIQQHAEGWAFQIAQVYAVRGEPDAMFKWLEQAWNARDPGMQALLYDAMLLRYRNDPRYAALVKQVGLPWPPVVVAPAAVVKP
ncbi:MAG TPA: tetratricopeptide repeat protein [Thermomonas sp.]|jgi:TolB-like protein/lipoprotein NlpI|uniref:tetratricopeptide repeat protein n=1 Tax=Thermomonas sp. TaxID=1971895 RepID=UPI002B8AE941|nr:tetratricopeptide repeat protein [Thermomonas sp.]HOV95349.1 tetratricopeptide repeat protein [Thermomonas sp.]